MNEIFYTCLPIALGLAVLAWVLRTNKKNRDAVIRVTTNSTPKNKERIYTPLIHEELMEESRNKHRGC